MFRRALLLRRVGPLRQGSARRIRHSTNAAAAPPSSSGVTVEAAEEKLSWLGWPMRNPITTLFLTAGSTWAYTLWIANKARQRRDDEEEKVKNSMPATADELLELRALNDVPSAAVASLPAEAARVGCSGGLASREQVMQLLRKVAADGMPLKEEYVIERLLMALPDAEADSRSVDVRLVTGVLAFLSSGSVRERLEIIYRSLGSEVIPASVGRSWGFGGGTSTWDSAAAEAALKEPPPSSIDSSRLVPLLAALMATGQMPPEKMVVTEELGVNSLGFARNWFEIEVSREYPAHEMVTDLLQYIPPAAAAEGSTASTEAGQQGGNGEGGGGTGGGSGGSVESVGAVGGGAGASSATDGAASPGAASSERVDLERFIELMQSNTACVWGECYQVNERKRLLKEAADAEEYARNPPWYRRAWNTVSGATHAVLPTPAAEPAPVVREAEPPPVFEPLPPVYLADGKTLAPFVPSEAFRGRREGYVFKAGREGLGYYIDGVSGAPRAAAGAGQVWPRVS